MARRAWGYCLNSWHSEQRGNGCRREGHNGRKGGHDGRGSGLAHVLEGLLAHGARDSEPEGGRGDLGGSSNFKGVSNVGTQNAVTLALNRPICASI